MNLFIFLVILFKFYSLKGETEMNNTHDLCTKRLVSAGCNDGGSLLEDNVCVNADYQNHIPPYSLTDVGIKFLQWPQIIEIDERKSTITVDAIKMANSWSDPRVHINLRDLETEKLLKPPDAVKDIRLLRLTFQNVCNSFKDGHSIKIWTPQDQGFHIKGQLGMKADIGVGIWGILNTEILFTVPINQSRPLITTLMKFKVNIQCKFDYVGYPMDKQKCSLTFGSSTISRLNLKMDDAKEICQTTKKSYERNGFFVSASCFYEVKEQYGVGINFFLDRVITKYLCQYYLPSAIIVFVSQISFVIPISALPGRISLVVTQFLTLTTIFMNEQVIAFLDR